VKKYWEETKHVGRFSLFSTTFVGGKETKNVEFPQTVRGGGENMVWFSKPASEGKLQQVSK